MYTTYTSYFSVPCQLPISKNSSFYIYKTFIKIINPSILLSSVQCQTILVVKGSAGTQLLNKSIYGKLHFDD